MLVSVARIELALQRPKRRVIPFHYTENYIPLYSAIFGGGWEDRTPTSCLQSTCAPIITNPPKPLLSVICRFAKNVASTGERITVISDSVGRTLTVE